MKIENKSLSGVIWGLQAGLFATSTILALGTVAAAFVLSNELAGKLPIPAMFQHAASIIVTGLIWLAVDGTMGKNFYFASSYLQSKRRKDAGLQHVSTWTVRFILFFSIVQILISTTLSTITAFVLPTILIESPDDSQYTETLNAHNATYNATISSIDKDISEAKQSEKKRIADAKKEGHQIVVQAVASGSEQNQKLYQSGNNWFFTEKRKKYSSMIAYRERIQAAKKDSASLVQKERGALATLQNAKLSALGQTPDKSGTLAALGKSLEHKITTNQYLKATVSGTLIYIDIVSGILFTVLTLLLVSFKVKPSNVSAMEIVFAGISNKSANMWSYIGSKMNIDINNIHEIEFEVSQQQPKQAPPSQNPAPGQTILVRDDGQDRQFYELQKTVYDLKTENKELSEKLSQLLDSSEKLLSDNDSSAKTVVKNIETVSDRNLIDATVKQYDRQFTSSKKETRDKNADKYKIGRAELERRGFKTVFEGTKVKFVKSV